MLSKPVTVGEQKVSHFKASWLLLKESWRFLLADSELLLVPVIATIIMVMLFALLIIGLLVSGFVVATPDAAWTTEGVIFIAGSYLITAFVVALSQAVVTHTVLLRTKGGNATLWQSLAVTLRHIPTLFLWSLISATVGVLLRTISEHSPRLGRIAASFLGAAWGVVTYFVVPAIIIDNKATLEALTHSGKVFQKTWGETIITNISLGLMFFCLHVTAVGIFLGTYFLSIKLQIPAVFLVSGILYVVWLFAAIAVQQVLNSIIVALLYIYATTSTPPTNFNADLLTAIVARTNKAGVTDSVPALGVS